MNFTVLPVGTRPRPVPNQAYLLSDNWDDWFKFATLFALVIFDEEERKHDIGGVKIGKFGMPKGQYNRPDLPDENFDSSNDALPLVNNLNSSQAICAK